MKNETKMPVQHSRRRPVSSLFGMIKGFLSRLFYIISLVWETAPWLFISMIALCLIDGFMPVIGSWITKFLVDNISELVIERGVDPTILSGTFWQVITGKEMRAIIILFGIQFIHFFAKRILDRLNSMINVVAGELVVNHIKLKIINKAKTVDMRSFDIPGFYEKLENANREASMRPVNILMATFRVVSSLISVVSYVVVLAILSPLAPILIVLSAVPGAIVNYVYRNRNFKYMRRHSKDRRAMNYYSDLMVNKDYVKEIKILGLGDTFIGKYKAVFKNYYKGLKRLVVRETILRIIVSFVFSVASIVLFVFVAYRVVMGDSTIGDFSLYTGAITSVATYVTLLITSTATIYEGTLFIDNMIEYMKEKRTVVSTLSEPAAVNRGAQHTIEFKNVAFKYPGTEKFVIKNFNLSLKSGDSVVLVGLNGAGKTTLVKLLTRLYDVTEGEILLDGRNVKEYSPEEYYDLFGIIFQDFGKYAQTVSENIEFGDVDRKHEESDVIEAAKSGNAHDFITALPAGYDTPLTRIFEENGVELSGGQWQKLSVSRAFFKDSDILILDEPTASLDALAEEEIFAQFSRLAEGKISIFVSHRLSSATSAGKIVVINNGEPVEVGTHQELMELGGEYYTLFSTQAHRYTGEDF